MAEHIQELAPRLADACENRLGLQNKTVAKAYYNGRRAFCAFVGTQTKQLEVRI